MINLAIRIILNNLPRLQVRFEELSRLDLYVGVPSDAPERRKDQGSSRVKAANGNVSGGTLDTSINNATIAYLNDVGSPAMNIPQRSFMRPGINDSKSFIIRRMERGARDILNGIPNSTHTTLSVCGFAAQNAIRKRINNGIPPPLSERTLKDRIRNRRGAIGAKAELARRAGGGMPDVDLAKPLVNTGQLRNSITFVIKPK